MQAMKMNDPQSCFSDSLVESVKCIDYQISDDPSPLQFTQCFHEVSSEQELQTILSHSNQEQWRGYQILYFSLVILCGLFLTVFRSICQRNSYQPLQITESMMQQILRAYDVNPGITRLSSSFYLRNKNYEESVCVPWTEFQSQGRTEVLYSIRYPEYKPDYESWVIRHTGVYHLTDFRKEQHVFILFEPLPNSQFRKRLQDELNKDMNKLHEDPLLIHRMLYTTYFSNWRGYILSIENRLLLVEGKSFASYIDQPLLIGHEDLGKLYKIEAQLHQVESILASSSDAFSELGSLVNDLAVRWPASRAHRDASLRNRERECLAYIRTVKTMLATVRSNIEFLANTVILRDQVVGKEQNVLMMEQNGNMVNQNQHMIRLNKSAVFLTIVTLIYLPSSWLGTFFGMNFFDLDTNTHRLVSTSMIWIYVVSSLGLTGLTFLLYYFLLQRDGRLFTRLEPTVQANRLNSQWTILKKRLTTWQGEAMEKESSNV